MQKSRKPFAHNNRKRKAEAVAADDERDVRHGSRRRVLALTSAPAAIVAETLTGFIGGNGVVTPDAAWFPRGAAAPGLIRLDEAPGFLKNPEHKAALHDWWISGEPALNRALTPKRQAGAFAARPPRLPAFDLASTFTPAGADEDARGGILLVRAAAHIGELNSDHSHQREKNALPQIHKAFAEAAEGWNALLLARAAERGYKLSHRVKLSTDSHFRLSCDFALAWKTASLGVPTVLLYLGFLGAEELEPDGRLIFRDRAMWEQCVFEKTSKPLPEEIWDASFTAPGGAALTVLRAAASVDLPAE